MRGARPCFVLSVLALLLAWTAVSPHHLQTGSYRHAYADSLLGTQTAEFPTWLVKWHGAKTKGGDALPFTVMLGSQPEAGISIVRPSPGMDTDKWLGILAAMPEVEYVHPNGAVGLLSSPSSADDAVPNDPIYDQQRYLKQIGADKAWRVAREQTDFKIALIDTGVDLNHPDLKDNLVEGINLVSKGKPPADDNGHGTLVAGVLAAVGNNSKGITGVLWKAKLMPIKALDSKGQGEEDRLGEAILYAVNNGAKIVVLSVGLYRHSPYMADIVDYAESKGVLLVAASGNDGQLLGSRAAVKYPAAYPTVVAVAGVTASGAPEKRSNPGPEVDIAAPWQVYTTALGGGYKRDQGTSMAAPQVAAAAALLWAASPELKPYQIREQLRQSAKDIGAKGRDDWSGYGLLQIGDLLAAKLTVDGFEPNDTRRTAGMLPLGKMRPARLTGGTDADWYKLNLKQDGILHVRFKGTREEDAAMPPVRIILHDDSRQAQEADVRISDRTMEWPVRQGIAYLEVRLADSGKKTVLPYQLSAQMKPAADAYEKNDKPYEAYTLSPVTQTLTGTFHQKGDRDWYSVTLDKAGTIRVNVATDTARIDPAFMIQRAGEREALYDEKGDGEAEQSGAIAVKPGKYYIRVHNAAAAEASPVTGTYTLKLEVETRFEDPNEPNDEYYSSTVLNPRTNYKGVIDSLEDQDWYQLRLDGTHIVTLRLDDFPSNREMRIEGYDKRQKLVFSTKSEPGKRSLVTNQLLQAGTYYVKLTADRPFAESLYKFTMTADKLVAGFRDIEGHWAETAIASLSHKSVVSGLGEYRFSPDRSITRAEAAAVIVRAFGADNNLAPVSEFKDVGKDHWASSLIRQASRAGYVSGLPDGRFDPSRAVTRAEVAVMLGRALGSKPVMTVMEPFSDLSPDHWAAGMLVRMHADGVIGGYPGLAVKPNGTASRAEFATMVYRALARRG
ncbi:S8 family serine peptidase [Paenibacillus tarimensis]|uniref:S8 family serine peptidase n=1 Tax=Paenibacillus tarimensis TaxID=416012 RepID=UPI001F1E5629|nr:S8 family serine peptidase [Paenibacillus tarimensis]MCF2944162.1 S8 family serine peptidase [Paenibacillus tarimensis]